MNYKKLFFPIGGGDELQERIFGALLITKALSANLEVLKCGFKTNISIYKRMSLPQDILNNINEVVENQHKDENEEVKVLLKDAAKEIDIEITSQACEDKTCAYVKLKEGIRSELIEQESKFSDLVIAASPPNGVTTATFETAVLKSGKPVLMFPRKLKKFSMDSIIIGWNNSTESSRALSCSIELLKQAQRVHIVSSDEYIKDLDAMTNIVSYLKIHGIDASYEIVKTTRIPGQALLNAALDGNFDLIVAGAFGHKGLKELMFGGSTRYLLEKSNLPIFMSH